MKTAPTQSQTEKLTNDPVGIRRAVELLKSGAQVAFPTETVYGLGADACNDTAIAGIYAAKGRPSFNPLIAHVADEAMARKLVDFTPGAGRLAAAFWPGALTMVLPLNPDAGVSKLVTAGMDTLAVRVPDHPLAHPLLRDFGGPVAAPSANPSGRISPTHSDHVMAGLDGKIAAVVLGGACGVGVESTIIGFDPDPVLLRAGGLPVEAIEACLGQPLRHIVNADMPTAPGQLSSHYAPRGDVRLNADAAQSGEVLLGFGYVDATLNLSPTGDLIEAAANLFEMLHQLDAMGADKIAISPIPNTGLGLAINDRLRRAAAPRP
ncbi:L-threonylcarbamoyladenylate synthase [Aestuariibius sp. HNIBRBA575]|uniref:L-threonylcarbamoyladenylate synthase n=1 Tax=Aestuariibius sp. HNIBRBA575 TaxID=3233343 RepID=UPI0034A511E6